MTRSSNGMQSVMPVKPVAPYVGGKSKLSKVIISHIDTIPHKAYCEAFVGMGGIFLRRGSKPKTEVINDYNGEVANLFRVLNQHYTAFLDMLKWQLSTRREYVRLVNTRPDTLTDLQRAARFLYVQRLAFWRETFWK
jgi:DNA adenine methylase